MTRGLPPGASVGSREVDFLLPSSLAQGLAPCLCLPFYPFGVLSLPAGGMGVRLISDHPCSQLDTSRVPENITEAHMESAGRWRV